jgi:hypothetical protein
MKLEKLNAKDAEQSLHGFFCGFCEIFASFAFKLIA